jgi:membrane protease YdiL (CAAX protease family)
MVAPGSSQKVRHARCSGHPSVPRHWIGLLLIGYPLLHLVRSIAGHTLGRDGVAGLGYYIPFWLTVVILQALGVVLVMRAMRAAGAGLADLGLRVSARRGVITIALLVAVGVALIVYRALVPSNAVPASPSAMPVTVPDRAVWLLAGLTSAFSEELLYRGFAITALHGRGVPLALVVAVAQAPWILNHGLTGMEQVPFYVASGLLFTGLYLWRRSLYPGMVLHALLNLAVLAA